MSRERRNHTRPSRRRWRLSPSRAIERWRSLPSSSTSIPTRSHCGRRCRKAALCRRISMVDQALHEHVAALTARHANRSRRLIKCAKNSGQCRPFRPRWSAGRRSATLHLAAIYQISKPPLLRKKGTRSRRRLMSHGLPLGIMPGATKARWRPSGSRAPSMTARFSASC